MAVRVTATEVKAIMDTSLADAVVDTFIIVGNQMTDRVQTNDADSTLSAAELKEIERWLSAHFVRIMEIASASEKAGDVSQKFQYKVDLNLNQTQYGTTAITLDYSGYLGKLQKDAMNGGQRAASMLTLGTKEEDYPTADAPGA